MSTPKTWYHDAPLVIAHRGASSLAPENTIAAIRTAATLGADGIEVDVKLSRDGVPVIHHDLTVDRTTDGKGKLKDLTLSELKQLDAGLGFSEQFRGERIPTLHEMLAFAGDGMLLNLELTNYGTPFDGLPYAVVKMLKEAGLAENILISSFNPLNLIRVKRADPNMRLALLIGGRLPAWIHKLLKCLTPHHDLHPNYSLVNEQLIRDIHNKGGRVNVWTVNHLGQILELLERGVDGIITDDVEVALAARGQFLDP